MKTTELKILVASALAFMAASAQALQPEVLYRFQAASPTNANGANPRAGLVLGRDGNFYGTTRTGGNSDGGTVFKVTTNGLLTSLASFDRFSFDYYNSGRRPHAALALGNDGNFYGTTAGWSDRRHPSPEKS